jgi:hypothetical protein
VSLPVGSAVAPVVLDIVDSPGDAHAPFDTYPRPSEVLVLAAAGAAEGAADVVPSVVGVVVAVVVTVLVTVVAVAVAVA